MKKISLMLAILLLISSFAFSVNASTSNMKIEGEQITAKAGDTVDVTYTVTKNTGVMAINVYYAADDGLAINSITNKFSSSMSYSYNVSSLWDGASNVTDVGDLVTLNVTLADDIAPGTYEVRLIVIEAYDEDVNDLVVDIINAKIVVENEDEEEPTIDPNANIGIVGSKVVAKAGDTVDVTYTVTKNTGVMAINVYYEADDGLAINSITNKFSSSMSYSYNVSSLWDGASNVTDVGELVTLNVTLADDIAPGTYEVKLIVIEAYDEDVNDLVVDVINAKIVVENGGDEASYIIDDNITVFETSIVYTTSDENDNCNPLLTIKKGDASFDLVCVYNQFGNISIAADGTYALLYDKEGNELCFNSTTPTEVTVVYNDINGTVRCYVNKTIAYVYIGEKLVMTNDIAVSDSSFTPATGEESVVVADGVTLKSVYNIGDSGTSEVVAFQEHNEENAIRILAGVDMPWYGAIGFELEVYKDGVGQGVEVRTSQLIYESILSNGETVDASEYGHNFFAACTIDGVDVSDGSTYYINVKPFTQVGETIYRGALAKINIDANGDYSFAE